MADEELKLADVVSDVVNTEAIPEAEKIKSLANLARKQIAQEEVVEQLELALKGAKETLTKLSEHDIPELFNELGLSEFKLSNGLRVKVNPYYTARITDEKAYDWLETRGHGDMIKGEFVVHYRKSSIKDLDKLRALAAAMGFTITDKYGVHPMTLKAWVRSQIESGAECDRELFNVYTGFKTKIGR